MESATKGRRFKLRSSREPLFCLAEPADGFLATNSSLWGGTALADLKDNVSIPSLTLRAYSAVLWLRGLVSSPSEALRELGTEV
jgi:hypothetical protein